MAKLALLIGVGLWIGLVTFVFWPREVGMDPAFQVGCMLGGTIAIGGLTIDLIQTANARHVEIKGNKTIKYFHPLDDTLAVFRNGRWEPTEPTLDAPTPDLQAESRDPAPEIRLPSGLARDPFYESPRCPRCGSPGRFDEIKTVGHYGEGVYRSTITCPKCGKPFRHSAPYDVEVYRENRWWTIAVPGIDGLTRSEVQRIAREYIADQNDMRQEDVIVRVNER